MTKIIEYLESKDPEEITESDLEVLEWCVDQQQQEINNPREDYSKLFTIEY